MKSLQLLRSIRETPWAILPTALSDILEIVASSDPPYAVYGEPPRQAYKQGVVAVLPLFGLLYPRVDAWNCFGGTCIETFSASFRAAMADPEIGAVLLDVNSPGGLIDLVPELAAEIRDVRVRKGSRYGAKPIVASVNTQATSAAYWLASQVDEIAITPSGEVGSIGVFATHQDMTGLEEKIGIKTTLIGAGLHKLDESPFAPLTDGAKAAIQHRVDAYYDMFIADVAAGRNVSAERVRSGYGEGRVVVATDALALGMVDRIETFEDTVTRLVTAAANSATPTSATAFQTHQVQTHQGTTFADEAQHALEHVERLVGRTRALIALRALSGRGLSAANRGRLAAVSASLKEADTALAELFTDEGQVAVLREVARFELLRST